MRLRSFLRDRYLLSFLLGGLGIALTSMRVSVQPLAWVAYAPLLAPLLLASGWKRHLWLLAVLLAAFHLAVAKIVTPPLTYGPVPLFAVPYALLTFAAIAAAAWVARRIGLRWGIYFLPCALVFLEWLQYTYSPQSAWGALAFTQVRDLSLLQTASLAGIAGISFLVALGSSLAAALAAGGARRLRMDAAVFALLLLAAHLYGELRLQRDAPGPSLRVAAVSSPFPAEETPAAFADLSLARSRDGELWARSARAAALGARLVAWNEAATLLARENEPALVETGRGFARDHGVHLVMAYGVLLSRAPLRFENKYLWVLPDGSLADEYEKRHPVPGEGSVPGNRPARVIDVPGGKASGAICYDYDFPAIPLEHVRGGAGLSVIPSSDWRGIDPLHSDMARLLGVAAGLSLLRPVRSATSFASDPYGRVTAAMRFYEEGDGVMIARARAIAVPTLYARTGDVLPLLAAGFALALLAATALAGRRRNPPG